MIKVEPLDGVEVNRYAKNIWYKVMENSLKETGSTLV